MVKVFSKMLLLILVLIIFTSCSSQVINSDNTQLPQSSVITTASDELQDWIGIYRFSGGIYDEPHGYVRVCRIVIFRQNSDYFANISVTGSQTILKLRTVVKGDAEIINLVFHEYLPKNFHEPYEKGDLLLSFVKNEDNIYTYWGEICPMLDENSVQGKVYFEKQVEDN